MVVFTQKKMTSLHSLYGGDAQIMSKVGFEAFQL